MGSSFDGGLGRLVPSDWRHVERYPLGSVQKSVTLEVNRVLKLDARMRRHYLQGDKNACTGFSASWMMSILNRRTYNPWWLWDRAKERDEWPETNPGDNNGSSVRAACDVLREQGHCTVRGGKCGPVDPGQGISENRWARSVDEMRTAISKGNPVVVGVNWYNDFNAPVFGPGGRWWVGRNVDMLGSTGRMGHAICTYAAFDRWQAFGWVNTWEDYPLVLIPYKTMERLLREDGEACLITDRP